MTTKKIDPRDITEKSDLLAAREGTEILKDESGKVKIYIRSLTSEERIFTHARSSGSVLGEAHWAFRIGVTRVTGWAPRGKAFRLETEEFTGCMGSRFDVMTKECFDQFHERIKDEIGGRVMRLSNPDPGSENKTAFTSASSEDPE